MPDATTTPEQDLEKVLGHSPVQKSAKAVGPQQTPEDDIQKILGKPLSPAPKKKSMFLAPEERTGSQMKAKPGAAEGPFSFGDEGIGKAIGAASTVDKPIEETIAKVGKFTNDKIDQAADFLTSGERRDRDWLAANGYPTLAKTAAYAEAINPINIQREMYKVAAGMVTDPKNWPFILEGGGAVRPAVKTTGTALFTVMQQYGAIDALKNHDWASAAMQEAFALLGMKDLPAGVKESIGKEASHQASGKTAPVMEPMPEEKKAEGMTPPPEVAKAEPMPVAGKAPVSKGKTHAERTEQALATERTESGKVLGHPLQGPPAEDLGAKTRAEMPPIPRGEKRKIPRTAEELQTKEFWKQARKEMGEDADLEDVEKRVNELKKQSGPVNKSEFKNGSTQADIPEHSEAHAALEAARHVIADADVAGKGKDVGGNHVTVRYGIQSDDVEGVRKFLQKQKPFEATLGKTEKFDPTEQSEGAAVIKAPIDSQEMHRINGELEKHGDFIDPTFDYKPHATVAYVKPETAHKYVGMDMTNGKKFLVDSITISGRDGKQEVVKLEGKGEEAAPSVTPEGKAIPAGAQMMHPKKIEADPRRFQFRTEMSESGLGDVDQYNPDLGGVISVWKDPADGKTYVVNGHHRLDLAKRAGANNVLVRYLDVATAKEARAIGALQNIAEDKASGIDAAKFLRDTGQTPEDLKKMGFPLTGKAAKEGLALSRLSDPIFERVTMGEIPAGRAAVIGEELPDYADQTAVLQMIDSQGKKGVRLTDAEIREMARDAKADQKVSKTTMDLFGESTIEKSSSVEKAKLSVWLQKQLSRDKKLFGYVAKTERARELAKAGNIIDVDQSKAVAETSKITEEVYQRLVRAKGPIADALREGAARWAAGDDEKTVKSETYQKVQAAVEQELKGGTYTPEPTDPIPAMGESRLREVLRSHPGMAGLADDLVDQASIITQNAIGMPLDEFLRKNWSDVKVEGTPGKDSLRQDESLWAWVKQSGNNLSIEPYGEQLSMFGDGEKTYMLRNKKGQEAMVLESQLKKLGQDFPSLQKKISFMNYTGNAVDLAPTGEVPTSGPTEQTSLFGNLQRGVEDEEGSLFGPMEDEDPKLLFQEDNPVWYAKSQHILDDPKMPGAQTGHQWLAMLENKGVKADELKWMGIDDFLRDKKKVTKQELQDYIRENQVEVKEVARVEKGPSDDIREWLDSNQRHRDEMIADLDADGYGLDKKPDGSYDVADMDGNWLDPKDVPIAVRYDVNQIIALDREIDSLHRQNESAQGGTKFNRHDLILGGERKNYSELLLTLPEKPGERGPKGWGDTAGGTADTTNFRSSHFEEPNILAHVRFDERTDADGKRILFLEEVQSDWHQRGKKIGYRGVGTKEKEERLKRLKVERDAAREPLLEMVRLADDLGWDSSSDALHAIASGVLEPDAIDETGIPGFREAAKKFRAAHLAWKQVEISLQQSTSGVPDAPFKTDWHEMAMKRMLRWAAEHGYDKLSWVTGEQTADRYNLAKQVSDDGIRWSVNHDGTVQVHALARETGGGLINRALPKAELERYLGKDVAKQIIESVDRGVQIGQLTGDSLKVGGEWARNLYDRAIPNFLSKYGKKWGAKVGHTDVARGNKIEVLNADFLSDIRISQAMPQFIAPESRPWGVVLELDSPNNADVVGWYATAEEAKRAADSYRPSATTNVHSMDITDSMRKSVMEGQPLFQGKKGATEFLNDGKAMVYLFKNADPSTFLHEFYHTLEPYLKPEDKAVINAALDKLGIKDPRERKETQARWFEEFHTNGEAPTEAVKPIFQRIQEIMRKIYEAIKDSPLIKPSKEVENLFNRWYGGEPEKLAPERELELLLGKTLEPSDIEPTSLFFGEEGQKPLLDIDDKSDAAKEFTAPPISITAEELGGFEPPPGMETPGPGAKNVNTVRETPADILQLRDSLAAVTSPHMGMAERMKKAANLASAMSRGADNMTQKWNAMKASSAAIWNAFRRPMPWTDFKEMLGKWIWANDKAEDEAYQFAREVTRDIPDPLRREAIVNYIEAGGDSDTLLSQYIRSTNPKYKEGYRIATELNESERIVAENVKNYFESKLQAAIDARMLEHGVDNYINRIVKRPEKSEAVQKLIGEMSVGKLQTNPRFTMKRIFETSFGVEQAGFEHVNKDAGFLITAYDLSFNRAVAARAFIKSMLSGHASDGRPLVAISGSGKTVPTEEVGEQSYVIRPTTKPDQTYDYKSVDHPALRKWKWVAKDVEDNPIYMQGDLLVHPEAYRHLKNVLSKSVFKQHPVPRAILKGFTDLKGTMLSLSPFHQVQVGTHGIAHWVNPAMVDKIDFENPKTKSLISHGLQVVNHHALEEFSDGVGGSGYVKYVPGLGPLAQKYQAFLFGDYIPRLKHKMALAALERNMDRYKGKYSNDQIYELTANQANAAFGELNYRMLGRNPSVQDALRLVLLAPDFLEARARFVGQALKPGGAEQTVALVRMSSILWGGARVMNMIFNNGDPKYDKPFSVVIDGHEYSIRSIPGDLYHLYEDPRGFVLWRVNPFTVRPAMNLLAGKDSFGHKQSTVDAGVDYLKQIMPIPMEGFTRPQADYWKSFLESVGIRESVFRTPAADAAHKMQIDSLPANLTKEQLLHSIKIRELQKQYQDGTLLPWDLQKKIDDDELTPADEKKIMGKEGKFDELQRNLEHRSADEAMKIWELTTPQEKAELRDQMLTKIKRSTTITPRQKEQFTDELMIDAFTPPPEEGFHLPFSE